MPNKIKKLARFFQKCWQITLENNNWTHICKYISRCFWLNIILREKQEQSMKNLYRHDTFLAQNRTNYIHMHYPTYTHTYVHTYVSYIWDSCKVQQLNMFFIYASSFNRVSVSNFIGPFNGIIQFLCHGLISIRSSHLALNSKRFQKEDFKKRCFK